MASRFKSALVPAALTAVALFLAATAFAENLDRDVPTLLSGDGELVVTANGHVLWDSRTRIATTDSGVRAWDGHRDAPLFNRAGVEAFRPNGPTGRGTIRSSTGRALGTASGAGVRLTRDGSVSLVRRPDGSTYLVVDPNRVVLVERPDTES